jgi:hypothetical protein
VVGAKSLGLTDGDEWWKNDISSGCWLRNTLHSHNRTVALEDQNWCGRGGCGKTGWIVLSLGVDLAEQEDG